MKRFFFTVATLFVLGSVAQTRAAYVPAAPIVGVHFGSNGAAPTNWTLISSNQTTARNLTDESGATTGVSLAYFGGMQQFYSGPVKAHTVLNHTNDLSSLNGNVYSPYWSQSPWTAIFSNLDASAEYNIWVFGVRFGYTIGQHVTVTGSGPQLEFEQSGEADSLYINGSMGDSTSDLHSYANTITSAANGTLTVQVRGTFSTGGSTYSVSGLAIQRLSPAPANAVPAPAGLLLAATGLPLLVVLARKKFNRQDAKGAKKTNH